MLSSDRRRTKLHTLLLDYGTPVQYSVFECLLSDEDALKLKKAARKIIRPRTDNVRYYYLCEGCLKKVETTLGKEVLSKDPAAIVA